MKNDALIIHLRKARELACQYVGGYSAHFDSAEEFAYELGQAVEELEAGNEAVLEKLHLWFSPTSDWDDLVRMDGIELGQRVFDMLSERIRMFKHQYNSPVNFDM